MEYKLNETPFEMAEISTKLFNKTFLSDVTFVVEGKDIFAHSFILMVRSSVFQEQLEETFGAKKLISISDYGYDVFYQLIHFIYTDQYDSESVDDLHLLELAQKYNVIRLINELLESSITINRLKRFNFCLSKQHKIGLNITKIQLANNLSPYLHSEQFLVIHPGTMLEILKFDQLSGDVRELDLLDALVRWLNHNCVQNQITFSECRQKFDHLIRLIRFPAMSHEELLFIKTKYPELLTKSDFLNIAGYKIFGPEFDDVIWNCLPRKDLIWPYEWKTYPGTIEFETKFSVSSDLIFSGFVVGAPLLSKNIRITIECQQCDSDEIKRINLNQAKGYSFFMIISVGASIRVRPNFIYTIGYKYEHMYIGNMAYVHGYFCRNSQTDLIINAPRNSVEILEARDTMIEILFLEPDDAKID